MLLGILPFYLGILAQSFLLIQEKFEKIDLVVIVLSAILSLGGLIPGKGEDVYSLYGHLFLVAIIFCVIYAVFFRKKLLLKINKEILAIWNVIFLYITFQHVSIIQNPILSTIVIIPSLFVLANILFSFDSRYSLKVAFYVWFLIMIVGIASSHFAFTSLDIFFTPDHALTASPIEMFFIGSAFLYIAVNFWYIISLIPLPGKNQKFKQRLINVKKDMDDLVSDYDPEKINWTGTALLVVSVIVLSTNLFYHYAQDSLIIPILIVCGPIIARIIGTKATPMVKDSTASDIQSL